MKIAIPVNEKNTESKICEFFGRTNFFLIFDSDTKEYEFVSNIAKDSQGGAGIKAAQQLIDEKVDIVIVTQLGNNAISLLNESNIVTYKGIKESSKENISMYLNNELERFNVM